VTVFDMEITLRAGPIYEGPVFLTDGYMNLAILPAKTRGEETVSLNHFGFRVEEIENITKGLLAAGIQEPTIRPAVTLNIVAQTPVAMRLMLLHTASRKIQLRARTKLHPVSKRQIRVPGNHQAPG